MDFEEARRQMVFHQMISRGIQNPQVIEAFLSVPRHLFVPPELREESYRDRPLSIGLGQTISQPYIVAFMTQELFGHPRTKVLDIGTGSGYQTAILAQLAHQVYSIERIPELLEAASRTLAELKIENVQLQLGDGSLGWPEQAPYDGILVTAAAPAVPQPLLEQLAESGSLVLPIGTALQQTLKVIEREGGKFHSRSLCECVFVPMIGRYGWEVS